MSGGLIIDFDNTLLVDPLFYGEVYAPMVRETVRAAHGAEGVALLDWHQSTTGHWGVLALAFFGIAFARLAERLDTVAVAGLAVPPGLAAALAANDQPKVIYTGSPARLAERVLDHWGLGHHFAEVVGWRPGEAMPLKHSHSPLPFAAIAARHGWQAQQSHSLGDTPDSDLVPARACGMGAIAIGPAPPGHDEGWPRHPDLATALIALAGGVQP